MPNADFNTPKQRLLLKNLLLINNRYSIKYFQFHIFSTESQCAKRFEQSVCSLSNNLFNSLPEARQIFKTISAFYVLPFACLV